jgi:hypothetical protein
MSIVNISLFYEAFIPGISFFFYSQKPSSVLRDSLMLSNEDGENENSGFIHKDLDINDIIDGTEL